MSMMKRSSSSCIVYVYAHDSSSIPDIKQIYVIIKQGDGGS